MCCGWSEINKWTKKVPIELNHIDGNPENHNIKNLELLCPNCHSLTEFYKRRGKGRKWRKTIFIK
jgi:5-methylcytosine-specific restriction endonuclease McrA